MQIGLYHLVPTRPAIMGILNVTPDSFSDGGRFSSAKAAAEEALRLVDEGADIIDIGGESSRPGALPVDLHVELLRTIPVIALIRKSSSIPISIDTTKAEVAREAIDAGADMINDISAGRFDSGMLKVAAEFQKPICLMHMQGSPRSMQLAPKYDDLMGEISSFLAEAVARAMRAGVSRDALLVDPGIGFGKSAKDNVTILQRLKEFNQLDLPILIGTSRKSFIGKLLGYDVEKRLEASLATLAIAIDGGAAILRVHDVLAGRRFLDTYLLCRPPSGEKYPRNGRRSETSA